MSMVHYALRLQIMERSSVVGHLGGLYLQDRESVTARSELQQSAKVRLLMRVRTSRVFRSRSVLLFFRHGLHLESLW